MKHFAASHSNAAMCSSRTAAMRIGSKEYQRPPHRLQLVRILLPNLIDHNRWHVNGEYHGIILSRSIPPIGGFEWWRGYAGLETPPTRLLLSVNDLDLIGCLPVNTFTCNISILHDERLSIHMRTVKGRANAVGDVKVDTLRFVRTMALR
jgi:hypothetical protein